MNKIFVPALVAALLTITTRPVQAQQEAAPEKSGFKSERIFVGASPGFGISDNMWNLAGSIQGGYSISKRVDVGIGFNSGFTKYKSMYDPLTGTSGQNFNIGASAFLRFHPLNALYFQVEPEHNWSRLKIDGSNNAGQTSNYQSSSVLAGVGYTTRKASRRSFFSFSVMVDLLHDANSPYINYYGASKPVFNAGFGFYLHRGKHF